MVYVIMLTGKWIECIHDDTQTKTLSTPNTEGFLFRFGKVAYALGWLPLVFLIQPLAYVVGYYTCHNRKNKWIEHFHDNTPPFSTCGLGSGSLIIVTYMKRIVYIVSFIFSQNKTLQNEGSANRTERTIEYDKKKRETLHKSRSPIKK